jgi:phage terminase Nu1 subunit (DNA packaging protein)
MATAVEIAKALNISARRVFQLAGDGVLPRAGHGKYELGACMAAYIRFLQLAIENRSDPTTRDLSAELLRQRTRRTAEEADMLAMKNREAHADLVREDLILREFGALITAHAAFVHELLGEQLPAALEGTTLVERRAIMDSAAVELLQRFVAWRPAGWRGERRDGR